jgi:excisionase family DNA binding protein
MLGAHRTSQVDPKPQPFDKGSETGPLERKNGLAGFEPLIDDSAAAKFLGGLHPKTVQRMARRGDIPHYRLGKYYRYRASELNDWLVLHSFSQINPPAQTQKETIQ